jgi:endo-1,4-beta-D-glucanase Y
VEKGFMRLKLICLLLVVFTARLTYAQSDVGRWERIVARSWEAYKERYIFCGIDCGDNLGLVFDPSRGYEAPSEGIGYGLLMAVMMDDQPTFDTIYDAADAILLDENGMFHWLARNDGSIAGRGAATDGDQDIAAALIFAQRQVERELWQQHPTRPYGERALELLDAIYEHVVFEGRYLQPGDRFGGEGQEIVNLSYFSPAWYRIYNQFEQSDRWAPVIDQGYESLFQTPGSEFGLAPDWSTAAGEPAYEFCDSIGRSRDICSFEMRYDAIRVPWRIGLDCLWFDDEHACEWTRRSMDFQRSQPDRSFARMYDMDGNPVVDYQDVAIVGMWLAAAVSAPDAQLQSWLQNRLLQLSPEVETAGYWGDNPQTYYNNSLAWFGASLVSGAFRNLAE